MPSPNSRKVAFIVSLEDQIEHVFAVLDNDSGHQLNYCQLLHHPKYKQQWSTSTANEFGRLAQGVGSCIKDTYTIHFITEHDILTN